MNLGQTQSHQSWNQVDWYSITSHLGSLGLQAGLTCPGDGAWGLVEDQSKAGIIETSDLLIAYYARTVYLYIGISAVLVINMYIYEA